MPRKIFILIDQMNPNIFFYSSTLPQQQLKNIYLNLKNSVTAITKIIKKKELNPE